MTKKLGFYKHPAWVSQAVVYQIFPDRFKKSGRVKHQNSIQLHEWGSRPSSAGFQGGDLYGVIDSLDYLQDFGITCIYLNPIFLSSANHRYHTSDYFTVDPILGGNVALDDLISALHNRGMKIILDGVFNHCGRGFWAFNDLLENGESSPYIDWFHINKWPLIPYPKKNQKCGYKCWWDNPALPKFNHENPYVCEYLFRVAKHWIEKGIDGWRLDVPDEIPFDFWCHFRSKIKQINPQAWILGEIWGDAKKWLKGDAFDGVMNYRIGWSIISWSGGGKISSNYKNPSYPLRSIDSNSFINILETTMSWYDMEVNKCQLNLLDSHDVPRALNSLMSDVRAFRIALFLLFLQPGAPCIYYGSEVELSGGIEPNCREPFPWDDIDKGDLRVFIRSLTILRKSLNSLVDNIFAWEMLEDDVIVGHLDQVDNISLKEYKITAFLNRSRKSGFQIPKYCGTQIFSFGTFDSNKSNLGPQSVILMKAPFM